MNADVDNNKAEKKITNYNNNALGKQSWEL